MYPGADTIFHGEEKSMIEITNQLSIPGEALRFTPSLSSGPGGQNVNKVSVADDSL
jgi:protein subunit release factor B